MVGIRLHEIPCDPLQNCAKKSKTVSSYLWSREVAPKNTSIPSLSTFHSLEVFPSTDQDALKHEEAERCLFTRKRRNAGQIFAFQEL